MKIEFSSVQLKRIALLFMIIDHIAAVFPSCPIFFRWLGRISMPIFLYCCVNAYDYTHSRRNYILRLYVFSIITSLVQFRFEIPNNFIRTMFSLVVILTVLEYSKKNKMVILYYTIWQLATILLTQYFVQHSSCDMEPFYSYIFPAITGSIFILEGGFVYVILGLIFYATKKNKKKLAISFIIFDIIYFIAAQFPDIIINIAYKIQDIIGFHTTLPFLESIMYATISDLVIYFMEYIMGIPVLFGGGSPLTSNFQWMMIFSLILILLYGGKKVKISRREKYFFYWFYPLHLFILYSIS